MRTTGFGTVFLGALATIALACSAVSCSSGDGPSPFDLSTADVASDSADEPLEIETTADITDDTGGDSAQEELQTESPDQTTEDGSSDVPLQPEDVMDASGTDLEPMTCIPTQSDAQGPYYLAGAPFKNPIADPDEPGPRIVLAGHVGDTTCTGIAGAVVDIWQTDAQGLYPTAEEGFRLRGKVTADEAGNYSFETVLPGFYEGRPRHVHAKVSGPGFGTLTTQIYFAGDPYLWPNDSCGPPTCHSDDSDRIIELHEETINGVKKQIGALDFTLSPELQ